MIGAIDVDLTARLRRVRGFTQKPTWNFLLQSKTKCWNIKCMTKYQTENGTRRISVLACH